LTRAVALPDRLADDGGAGAKLANLATGR